MMFGAIVTQAQQDIMDKMVDIKLSGQYVYGEGTHANVSMAYDLALKDLLNYVNQWRAESNKAPLKIGDLQGVGEELNGLSGDNHVCLLFLTNSQALEIESTSRSDVVSNLDKGPKQEKVQVGKTQPKVVKPVEKPVEELTKIEPVEELTKVDPVEELTKVDPVEQKHDQVPTKPVPATAKPTSFISDDIVETIKIQDNWPEVKDILTRYKQLNKIAETGFCNTLAEAPADAHCLLIDEMYGILAFLSPTQGNGRTNQKTRKLDSDNNYPNCKIIVWYR